MILSYTSLGCRVQVHLLPVDGPRGAVVGISAEADVCGACAPRWPTQMPMCL